MTGRRAINPHSELLLTNGRGGFFCGTVSGEIRRKWHGFWGAENPPRRRRLLIAGFEEVLTIGGREHRPGAHWKGGAWKPADITPAEVSRARIRWNLPGGGALEREFRMPTGSREQLLIVYTLSGTDAAAGVSLSIHPILPAEGAASALRVRVGPGADTAIPAGTPMKDVELAIERDCEKKWTGDFVRGGAIRVPLEVGRPRMVLFHTNHRSDSPDERAMIGARPAVMDEMVLAADQFIVRGADEHATILAGYPWFTDWGRDAMISIPGLCLCTGRTAEAREIVEHFLRHLKQGLIPNLFPEGDDPPRYNTVDATLWLVEMVFRLWSIEGLRARKDLWAKLREIIDWHERGTLNDVRVDSDGLLIGGSPGTQLTWMDVKVNGEVPVQRHGKAVEIQALWHNALRLVGGAAEVLGDAAFAAHCSGLADRVRKAFAARFITAGHDQLADVVDRDGPGTADWAIRPNMAIPFALTHNLIPEEKRADVLRCVAKHLLTPRGLRSLAPGHPSYKPIYRGDVVQRDHAYHQGTVWMWLIGPYLKGVHAERARVPELFAGAGAVMDGLLQHFHEEACIGQCNEIFDGDAPHTPRGCFAQAWSVAALIEVAALYGRR